MFAYDGFSGVFEAVEYFIVGGVSDASEGTSEALTGIFGHLGCCAENFVQRLFVQLGTFSSKVKDIEWNEFAFLLNLNELMISQ